MTTIRGFSVTKQKQKKKKHKKKQANENRIDPIDNVDK